MQDQSYSSAGSKKSHLGSKSKPGSKTGSRHQKTFNDRLARRDMTDNQMAAINLKKALDYYDLSPERRVSLKNDLAELDILKHLNMKYLAGALYILENIPKDEPLSAKHLSDDFIPTATVLVHITSETGKDSAEQIIKHKEVLLTYMIKVTIFRKDSTQHYVTEDSMDQIETSDHYAFEGKTTEERSAREHDILERAALEAEKEDGKSKPIFSGGISLPVPTAGDNY